MKAVSLSTLLALTAAGVEWAEPTWQTDTSTRPGGDVVFADTDHGFYGTADGELHRTQDGGQTWQKIWSQPGTAIGALAFLDAARGFLGSDSLYQTRDGGLTWRPADIGGTVPGIRSIDVIPAQCVHAAGPGTLLRSENSGQSWTRIDLSDRAEAISEVKFLDPATGFVCASSRGEALVLTTDDAGVTWREVYRARCLGDTPLRASFPTARIGYVTLPDRLIKTIDGGESWTEVPLPRAENAAGRGIGFLTAKKGWIGGLETRDGGRSWTSSPLSPGATRIRTSAADGTPMVYAIGGGVQIYR